MVTFGRMSERTKRRHRQFRRLGKEVREAGQVVTDRKGKPVRSRNGSQRVVAGRRNAVRASLADQEAKGFAGAVLAAIEAANSGKEPPDLKTYPLAEQSDGNEGWAQPSEQVRKCIEGAAFSPILLAVAVWDTVVMRYETPHGNMSAMSKLKVMQSPSRRQRLLLCEKPKTHPSIEELIRKGASVSQVQKALFLLIDQGEIPPAEWSLSKDGSQLHKWAKELYAPDPPRHFRRTPPPRHLLNLDKRMLCYWRKHRDYPNAREYVSELCKRIAPKRKKSDRTLSRVPKDEFNESVWEMFAEHASGEAVEAIGKRRQRHSPDY